MVEASLAVKAFGRAALGCYFGLSCASRPAASPATPGEATTPPAESQPAERAAESPPTLEPETAAPTGEFALLDIPGFLPAVVWIPAGTSSRSKPVVLATHGAYDNPESHCPFWRRIVQERAFVLCTRGRKISATEFFYPEHFFIDREDTAALEALRAHFGARIAAGPPLYAGYSQGAIHGAPLLQMRPQAHPRAVFIEGGAAWTKATAERYRKAGGQKLLFVCGTGGCRKGATRAVELLFKAGVDVRLIWVPTAGHDYPPAMGELITEQLGWLVEGDPRW